MLRICTKMLLPVLLTFLVAACEPEQLEIPPAQISAAPVALGNIVAKNSPRGYDLKTILRSKERTYSPNLQDLVLLAVVPSECGATEFSEVSMKYFAKLLSTPKAMDHFEHYKFLNRQAAKIGIGGHYFGSNGEYTKLVLKVEKDLSRFFNLSNDIIVLGQHNETLKDRENLADIYWYSIQDMESREEAYILADKILQLNQKYPQLINSPFISSDGYAAQNGQIVLGDGLIQLFAETGLSYDIVWTGILSHEWAHQIQFEYFNTWYPSGSFEDPAERTRTLELEADFLSGYYMTHKRGATYNWKRAEEFFELFYQAGDCSFEFKQHHGTPLQRKDASFRGYELAKAAQKKGKILSAEALHQHFKLVVLPEVLNELQYL